MCCKKAPKMYFNSKCAILLNIAYLKAVFSNTNDLVTINPIPISLSCQNLRTIVFQPQINPVEMLTCHCAACVYDKIGLYILILSVLDQDLLNS